MRGMTLGALALALVVYSPAAEHQDSWQRTFSLARSGERKLDIGIINGSIRVTGDGGHDIRVTVKEEYRAETPQDLATVREDFKLRIEESPTSVRFYLDPPKNQDRDRSRARIHFRQDFEVLVPRDISVSLRTINGQEISIAGITGQWHLKNINGRIEMKDMGGFGEAETLNGALRATFLRNPVQPSRFKNLNGVIDVSFQPELSADLALSTMNGDAYTDFEIAPIATVAVAGRSADGLQYRVSNRDRKVRVGQGGLEHSFSTLNGSIKIRKYGKA